MDWKSRNSEMLPKAFSLYQAGDLNGAETLCRSILSSDSRHSEAMTLLGTIHLQRGNREEGMRLIGRSLEINPSQPDALNIRGIVLYSLNRHDEALASYDRAIALNPDYIQAYYNRGIVLYSLNRHDEALACYDRAIALNPGQAELHNNRGNVLNNLRRYDEALASCDRAIALNPGYAQAHINRSNALNNLQRYDEALASCERAIALNSGQAEAHNNRGIALEGLKRHDESLASYDRAIALNPRYAKAYNNRGNVLNKLARHDEALASYDRAVALNPDYAEAYSNRGGTLNKLKRYEEALASCDRAIALNPGYAQAYNNRSIALNELNRYDEALASCDRAIALNPVLGEAHNNRGNLLTSLKRYDEALASYDRAIALNPDHADGHLNKGYLKILLGEYEEGWKLHEWRWKHDEKKTPRNFPRPLWLGQESLAGKTILLSTEQGFGDSIQFCRYAPMVEALGAKVVLETQQALVPLISTVKDSIRVIPLGNPLPEFDCHCPLMSLPLAFKTTVSTIPAKIPYLGTDPIKQRQWRNRMGAKTRPRIGLAWSGNKEHPNDHNRTISLSILTPVLGLDLEFHCLQKEIRPADREFLIKHPQIRLYENDLNDFSDTAALVSEMDLVVSVDTSAVHLAGAMGKPVWILLPFAPDYRWMTEREDCPWYPTARLCRQPRIGDWASVIRKVAAELKVL